MYVSSLLFVELDGLTYLFSQMVVTPTLPSYLVTYHSYLCFKTHVTIFYQLAFPVWFFLSCALTHNFMIFFLILTGIYKEKEYIFKGSSAHSLEKAMVPHSGTLAWKIPWTEEPGGLQSMGPLRARHNWATSVSLFTFMHWRRKWQPTPVFLPGESQGWRSLVGCCLWSATESDMTEVT